MSGKRRIILFIFLILTITDFYNCLFTGQEFNQLIRPIQMLVLLVWILSKTQFSLNSLLITIALVIASIADYVFYKYGSLQENTTIVFIITKNFLFLKILYESVKKMLKPSQKLYRWASNYLIALVGICFLMEGLDNWLTYVLAIQSGIIFLFISLQKADSAIFKQLYIGYALIVLSLIFGKILLTDSRWFVELIDRFAFVIGHLLFVSGLSKINLISNRTNSLDFRIFI